MIQGRIQWMGRVTEKGLENGEAYENTLQHGQPIVKPSNSTPTISGRWLFDTSISIHSSGRRQPF